MSESVSDDFKRLQTNIAILAKEYFHDAKRHPFACHPFGLRYMGMSFEIHPRIREKEGSDEVELRLEIYKVMFDGRLMEVVEAVI